MGALRDCFAPRAVSGPSWIRCRTRSPSVCRLRSCFYLWSLHENPRFGWIISLALALSCVLRLARFNANLDVIDQPRKAAGFNTGVPAPAGAGIALMPLYAWFVTEMPIFRDWRLVAPWLVFTALLMISNPPTLGWKRLRLPPDWRILRHLRGRPLRCNAVGRALDQPADPDGILSPAHPGWRDELRPTPPASGAYAARRGAGRPGRSRRALTADPEGYGMNAVGLCSWTLSRLNAQRGEHLRPIVDEPISGDHTERRNQCENEQKRADRIENHGMNLSPATQRTRFESVSLALCSLFVLFRRCVKSGGKYLRFG